MVQGFASQCLAQWSNGIPVIGSHPATNKPALELFWNSTCMLGAGAVPETKGVWILFCSWWSRRRIWRWRSLSPRRTSSGPSRARWSPLARLVRAGLTRFLRLHATSSNLLTVNRAAACQITRPDCSRPWYIMPWPCGCYGPLRAASIKCMLRSNMLRMRTCRSWKDIQIMCVLYLCCGVVAR